MSHAETYYAPALIVLPPGVIDYVEHDLKRPLNTLKRIQIEQPLVPPSPLSLPRMGRARAPWSGSKIYYLTFPQQGGYGGEVVFQIRSYPGYPGGDLIAGYDDALTPNDWINRLIMDREQPMPQYTEPQNAAKVVEKLLASEHHLLLAFARSLLPHYKHAGDEQLLSSLRWLSLMPRWPPQQICTAAYHAFNHVRNPEHPLAYCRDCDEIDEESINHGIATGYLSSTISINKALSVSDLKNPDRTEPYGVLTEADLQYTLQHMLDDRPHRLIRLMGEVIHEK